MRERALCVLPLDLAVDVLDELGRAEALEVQTYGHARRAAPAHATRARHAPVANNNTDDENPAGRHGLASATTAHNAIHALLDELTNVLADIVAERCMIRVGPGTTSDEYTSKSPPPGMSRRAFNGCCRRLAAAGDRRVWRRGRMWVAKREAIDERARRHATAKIVKGRGHHKPRSKQPASAPNEAKRTPPHRSNGRGQTGEKGPPR